MLGFQYSIVRGSPCALDADTPLGLSSDVNKRVVGFRVDLKSERMETSFPLHSNPILGWMYSTYLTLNLAHPPHSKLYTSCTSG